MQRYNPKEIEPKWQKIWDDTKVYQADLKTDRPKYIAMSMFNYPSGAGIHIGHAMNYTISDVKARFKRQQGYESYHPVGWDSFGLPAENYAIKAGVSPQKSMAKIIPDYHKQYKAMAWSNDWSKEIATHEPEYYKWTQWIFSEMYRHGLVYQDSRMQWWCDKCQTVLANEQVLDGKCWRHEGPDDPEVVKREVKQWFFKITEYADELLEAIDDLNWTESVKLAQKNWIGRSAGAEIDFKVKDSPESIKVFTTRPDTLFGATFMVLAPEHPLVGDITSAEYKAEVEKYIKSAQTKSDVERQATADKDKTGVATGAYAINPVNGEEIPVWIADYVLLGYGTGAIMAVPAHDQRDHEFANKFGLDIKPVVEAVYGEPQGDDIHKEKIIAVVRDPKTSKILVLDWGPRRDRHGGNMLIGGGVEGDEDLIEAAKREIAEETGYTDVKFVRQLEARGHGYFYSNVKNHNYCGHCTGLLFELASDKQDDTRMDEGEKDKFKVVWVDQNKVAPMLHDGIHETFYRQLILGEVYGGEGTMVNSGAYDGMASAEAREKIVKDLEVKGQAKPTVNYKMRDWSVTRQRYWGAPTPIINCPKCGPVLVPDKDLPVVLPELDDFKPAGDGRSALARATDWLKVDCPECGGPAERETDTLDTYIDSAWYMLRYFDPHNPDKIFDSDTVNKWLPVDFYNGADHATAHLLYARFITRFFHKLGLVNNPEPFRQMLYNGKVTAADGSAFSKTLGNGIDPLEIIGQGYGADALRTYLMFAAPLEFSVRWDSQGVPGTHRFLSRLWTLVQEYKAAQPASLTGQQQMALRRAAHRLIKKVTEDLEASSYNTAIAAAMGTLNEYYKLKIEALGQDDAWQEALEAMVAVVAPFAPHIADELWQQLGHDTTIQRDSWPKWDDKFLATDTVKIAIQVNGKVRATIEVAADAAEADVVKAALDDPKVKTYISGQPKKTVYVSGKLLSLVA